MKAAIFIIVIVGIVATSYLVWMNRASERILTAVIPIAIAAVAAVFIAVFVIGGEPASTIQFPASFHYKQQNKMPADFPSFGTGRTFVASLFSPAELYKAHPEFFNDPADPNGATLYHHLLQRAIIDWVAMNYHGNWQMEHLQFDLPFGRLERFQPAEGAFQDSKVLSRAEIAELLKGNMFADIPAVPAQQIALPPQTKVSISPPPSMLGGSGEIVFKNGFCTISIKTEYSFWLRGVGRYQALAGFTDEDNNRLATATYVVRIKSEFERLRIGNPAMRLYKDWAAQLSEGLRTAFDEQVIWSKTKEDFIFLKQLNTTGS